MTDVHLPVTGEQWDTAVHAVTPDAGKAHPRRRAPRGTPITSEDIFDAPAFDWANYLQRHLVLPGVNVTDLHPILGIRTAGLFADLVTVGLADDRPGYGVLEITSGYRSQAAQVALYQQICLVQGRCDYVANPYTPRSSGPDGEGVQRHGSNHMGQRQADRWHELLRLPRPVEVGYAIDIRNNGVAWSELHRRLPAAGLDWPLKGGPYEPWHLEAFPDSAERWLEGPWPRRPGVLRPLYVGLVGGDVRRLQRQLGAEALDGEFGVGTARLCRQAQRTLRLPVTGSWTVEDQRRFERPPRRVR